MKKAYRGKVLVLGQDTRSFLTVIRCLGRLRLEVQAAGCPSDSAARYSRYLKKLHHLPDYALDGRAWLEALAELLKRENFDLVIPCNDQNIIPLQVNRKFFEAAAKIYLLPDSAFKVVSDKFKSNQLAGGLGIPVPGEIKISELAQVSRRAGDFVFPLVLKPLSSFSLENLKSRNLVRKVNTKEELQSVLAEMLKSGEVLLQENFSGTGCGVELLAEGGEILLAFQHLRVHEPLLGGGSTYRKSVELNPELLSAASKLVKALDYTGVAMVEYRMNLKSGKWVFLEINGRFWGSLPLAAACGVDFPAALYRLLVEGKRDFARPYKTGIYCRNLTMDLDWLRENFRADPADSRLSLLTFWQVAGELKNILTFKERSDTFVPDDLMPAWLDLYYWLAAKARTVKSRLGLKLLEFWPVRKFLSRRLKQIARSAKTILFVCLGNICRSPFAADDARQVLPEGIKVYSAGYYPRMGRPSPEAALEAAKELGIDLSSHLSQAVTPEMIEQADLILVFEPDNRKAVISRYPGVKAGIFYLGILGEGPVVIKDPLGKGAEVFLKTYRRISSAIEELASSLRSKQGFLNNSKKLI